MRLRAAMEGRLQQVGASTDCSTKRSTRVFRPTDTVSMRQIVIAGRID